jgi:hypothetical protein
MFNSCPLDDNSTKLFFDGPMLYVIFDRIVTMNGWYITTSKSGKADQDPVRFKVEASLSDLQVYDYQDVGNINKNSSAGANNHKYTATSTGLLQQLNQSKWVLVGSSYTVSHQSLTLLHLYYVHVNITTSRGAVVPFNARIPWTDILFFVGVALTFSLCSLVMLIFSLQHMHDYNIYVVSGSFILAGVLMCISGIASLAITGDVNQVMLILYSMCNLSLGIGLVVIERKITMLTFVTGFFFILFIFIDSFVVYKVPEVGQRDIPSEGTILLLLSTFVYIRRKYTLRAAWKLIEKDMQAYNDKWTTIVTDPQHAAALQRIKLLSQRVRCNRVLRQCNRARGFQSGPGDAVQVCLPSVARSGSIAANSTSFLLRSDRASGCPASDPVDATVFSSVRDRSASLTATVYLNDPDLSLRMDCYDNSRDVEANMLSTSSYGMKEGVAGLESPRSKIYDGLFVEVEDDGLPGMVSTMHMYYACFMIYLYICILHILFAAC